MKNILYSILFLSVIIVFLSYFYISKNGINISIKKASNEQNTFQTLTSNENNVEFQVTPLNPSEFKIEINTHSVNLDFDLTKISVLYDNAGNSYKPIKWEGSEPGGHHGSGILRFPPMDSNAKSIKLVITDSTKREFEWNLK